ncbi:MAG TPA: 3-hydroxyacyl-CoA dehydrogenase NAD-binding domain-containing protein [Thermoanaerobaculia bacterium]|nr:3-hydroxyacyl-CoA dehydrogenase NAD-binding domain-containing protein [Thermoanaerobaculia bacterium]
MSSPVGSIEAPEPSAPPGRLIIEDGLAWLVLDEPGKKVNVLSSRALGWLGEQIDRLRDASPTGLVILSGKADSFVAGADLEELATLEDSESVIDLLQRGHELNGRLVDLPFPTVAAIHGACLGGGLELTLACRFRVATLHAKTKLGLPEVQLGLIPGLGGTQRLPRLIGVPAALDLILTGRQIDAKRAQKLGLVDEICHPADLRAATVKLARASGLLRLGIEKRRGKSQGFGARAAMLLAKIPGVSDSLVYGKARAGVLKKTGGHYPAPLVAIDIVHEGMRRPLPRALDLEAGAFAELVVSEVAKSLIGLFFLKTRGEARAAGIARGALPVEMIGVLGAGFMGSGVAQLAAEKGYRVVLKDQNPAAVGRGLGFCRERFRERVARRRMTEAEMRQAMGRIQGTVDDRPFARVDLVIEAVFEDLEVKRKVVQAVEAVAPESLIFASNTSTLPIAQIAATSARPERVVGMHFFSPVHKMPLLEVIRHPGTSDAALATAVAVGRRLGKTLIVVADGPGFYTSRILATFLNEAAWLLVEGATIEQIDAALTDWGFPVGPFTLLDEVGLDVAAHAGRTMAEAFSDRIETPEVFAKMLADGRLGRKAGKGFHTYGKGPKKVDPAVYELLGWRPKEIPTAEITERCVLQMLNEAVRCLEEEILASPEDGDIGAIFGLGFPPFRGGLFRTADRWGAGTTVGLLERLAAHHGRRFAPAARLVEMAERGERFYPAG